MISWAVLFVKIFGHWTKYLHLKYIGRVGQVLVLVRKGNFTSNMQKSLDMLNNCQVYRCKKGTFSKALTKVTLGPEMSL